MAVFKIVRVIGLVCLTCCLLGSAFGAPLDTWRWRNPLPTGNGLSGVSFWNGTFVAVGSGMQVLSSSDALNWSVQVVSGEGVLYQVAFGGGTYVAIGDTGKAPAWGQIFTSSDLVNWQPRNPINTNRLNSVAFGNGLFVAVGGGGTVLTSNSGAEWTVQSSGWTTILTHVVFGNGAFVAMSAGVSNSVLVSTDGMQWESKTVSDYPQHCLGFAAGRFYTAGGFTLSSSVNGTDWGTVSSPPTAMVTAFAEGAGSVLAATIGPLLASADGIQFTNVATTGYESSVNAMTFGNGRFVTVGGSQTLLQTSVDAINWTPVDDSPKSLLTDLAWGNGTYVAIGGGFPSASIPFNGGEPAVLLTASAEGPFRQQPFFTDMPLSRVRFVNGIFYLLGANGLLLLSTDGTNWTRRVSGAFEHLRGLADYNGLLVAVGDFGTIITSPNGHAWTRRLSATGYSLNGVAYGNGQFVAVGFSGALISSPDAMNWTAQFADTRQTLFDVCHGNDRFVAVGDAGRIFTSDDGAGWNAAPSGTSVVLRRVTFGDGAFVAVGDDGTVLSSTDGRQWTRRQLGAYWALYGAVFLNDSFFVLGQAGTILQTGTSSTFLRLVGEWNRAAGLFEMQILGANGVSVQVQSSDDLSMGWVDREGFANVTGPVRYVDPTSSSSAPAQRFYRAFIR